MFLQQVEATSASSKAAVEAAELRKTLEKEEERLLGLPFFSLIPAS